WWLTGVRGNIHFVAHNKYARQAVKGHLIYELYKIGVRPLLVAIAVINIVAIRMVLVSAEVELVNTLLYGNPADATNELWNSTYYVNISIAEGFDDEIIFLDAHGLDIISSHKANTSVTV